MHAARSLQRHNSLASGGSDAFVTRPCSSTRCRSSEPTMTTWLPSRRHGPSHASSEGHTTTRASPPRNSRFARSVWANGKKAQKCDSNTTNEKRSGHASDPATGPRRCITKIMHTRPPRTRLVGGARRRPIARGQTYALRPQSPTYSSRISSHTHPPHSRQLSDCSQSLTQQ